MTNDHERLEEAVTASGLAYQVQPAGVGVSYAFSNADGFILGSASNISAALAWLSGFRAAQTEAEWS